MIWGAMQRGRHAQSNFFKISGPNDHLRSLRIVMARYHVETTLHVKHVWGQC